MVKIAASRLRDLYVVTDRGHQIGTVYDLTVDEETGRIIALVVTPLEGKTYPDMVTDRDGFLLIPYSAVQSIREMVVLNERELGRRQMLAKLPKEVGVKPVRPEAELSKV